MAPKKKVEQKKVEKEVVHYAIVIEIKYWVMGLFARRKYLVHVMKTEKGNKMKLAVASNEASKMARTLFPKFKCRVITVEETHIHDATNEK